MSTWDELGAEFGGLDEIRLEETVVVVELGGSNLDVTVDDGGCAWVR